MKKLKEKERNKNLRCRKKCHQEMSNVEMNLKKGIIDQTAYTDMFKTMF